MRNLKVSSPNESNKFGEGKKERKSGEKKEGK